MDLPHLVGLDSHKMGKLGFQVLIWTSAYQLLSPTQDHASADQRTLADFPVQIASSCLGRTKSIGLIPSCHLELWVEH
jgi:hypothetical protein